MRNTQRIKALRASLRAALNSALVAREKLSRVLDVEELPDAPEFFTAAEVRDIRREHDAELRAFVQSLHSRTYARLAQLKFEHTPTTPERRAQLDWVMTLAKAKEIVAEHDLERATRATAAQIVRAGKRRRNERE
jgi:hypothetical protein